MAGLGLSREVMIDRQPPDMSTVVERADYPTARIHNQVRDGRVARAIEGERADSGNVAEHRSDHPAVTEHGDQLVRMGRSDPTDGSDGASSQLNVGLRPRYLAPFA